MTAEQRAELAAVWNALQSTPSYFEQNARAFAQEGDEPVHIADSFTVNRIVDGRLVPCAWADLSEAEKRDAYHRLFNPCGIG